MKKTLFYGMIVAAVAMLGIGFVSCSDDDSYDVKNVSVSVSGTTGAPIVITGIPEPEEISVEDVGIRSYLSTFETESSYVEVTAQCDDAASRLDIKVWVDGKPLKQVSGHSYVETGKVRI